MEWPVAVVVVVSMVLMALYRRREDWRLFEGQRIRQQLQRVLERRERP
jgi:hypothetical protein